MSDLETLIDMGFSKEKAERALQITNNMEGAMEWLLAHSEEDLPTATTAAPPPTPAVETPPSPTIPPATDGEAAATMTQSAESSTTTKPNNTIDAASLAALIALATTSATISAQQQKEQQQQQQQTNQETPSSAEPMTIDDTTVTAVTASTSHNATDDKTETSPVDATSQEAKSLKCNDCNRLFKSQTEVEFHAGKTGHYNFTESLEEKKPLSEDEKREQLAKLEEKLKQKRAEREENEKQAVLERERLRIKSGKDMSEARRKMEEMEMKKIVEQRKREKREEIEIRARIRAQIQADKDARKAELAGTKSDLPAESPPSQKPVINETDADTATKSPTNYTSSRIQIRLRDGKTLVETFTVNEQLSAVRLFIQIRTGSDISTFGLMTTFPKRVFTDDDMDKSLETLGLVPSAVLIVTKR